jgi:hypothetical protein
MSFYLVPPVRITAIAAADLSTFLNRFVSFDVNGQLVAPSVGGDVAGIVDDLGSGNGAVGTSVTVIIAGGAQLEAQAAIAAGDWVTPGNANGRGSPAAATGNWRVARAYGAAAAAGVRIPVIVHHAGQRPA